MGKSSWEAVDLRRQLHCAATAMLSCMPKARDPQLLLEDYVDYLRYNLGRSENTIRA